jgi:DNA-binding transcriptional LysR family regulator
MTLKEVAPTLRATILAHCRLGGFEPNIRFEVQLQQTVLSLVDEGAGVALVPTSMRKAQLAGVVFRRLVVAPLIEQVLVWSPANRNHVSRVFLISRGRDRTLLEVRIGSRRAHVQARDNPALAAAGARHGLIL